MQKLTIIDLASDTSTNEADRYKIEVKQASETSVKTMLHADPVSGDGRSQWLWFHLPNGDMIFGCYPMGETYFKTQHDHH